MFYPILLVAVGGALGSLARFGLSAWVIKQVNPIHFPWGTFTVNVLGCFLAGIFLLTAEKIPVLNQEARLFLVTGILGGFTTFSAFGIETLGLLRRGEVLIALSYACLSVIAGLIAMWLAYSLGKLILS
jgi:CrcB protein